MAITRIAADSAVDAASTSILQSENGFSVSTGQAIHVDVEWEATNTTVVITDLIGNVYTSLGAAFKSAGNAQWVQSFACLASIGTNAANKVLGTWALPASFKTINAVSFSYTLSLSFDNRVTFEVVSGTSISTAFTPTGTGNNFLVTACKAFNGGTWSQFDGTWTTITNPTDRLGQASSKIVTGTTPVNGGGSTTTTTNLLMSYVGFKETAGGGGGPGSQNRLLLGVG